MVEVYSIRKPTKEDIILNKKVKDEIIDWIRTICISGAIAICINIVAQPTMVSGQSMYPTLKNNDYLFINRLAYKSHMPQRGDVIVFKADLSGNNSSPKKNLVKRVIALPGEHLIIKDNNVYINGKHLEEDYLVDVYTDGDIDIIVPDNHIFAMGDNRENSDDSRQSYIGAISLDDVVGEVFIRIFPFDKIGQVK